MGNAQTLKQLEMVETSLRKNAKIAIIEHGISPTLLPGSLPVNVSSKKGTNQMKKEVGLWIDHREAVLVTITGRAEAMTRIYSDAEEIGQFAGSSRSARSQDAENMHERRYANVLERYYDAIIESIRDADSVQIFGPGEAKGELAKRLKTKNPSQRIVSVGTTDRLTDSQIAAKVRHCFPG